MAATAAPAIDSTAPEIRIENDDGNQAISISQGVSLETRLSYIVLIFVTAI
jgi:hypothetical protein